MPVDPLAGRQIQVIRGPATLRWGSQAIGGVVNVDNNRIPAALSPRPISGEIFGAGATVDSAREGSVLIDAGAGNVALHADAHGRRADIRVDLYDADARIHVGELTVYTVSGFMYFTTEESDRIMGSYWTIRRPALRAIATCLTRRHDIRHPDY